MFLTAKDRPGRTKATVCCGLLIGTAVEPVTETYITIWAGMRVLEIPSWLAFARTLVMRRTRTAVVPGGSIGTPSHTRELAPT